MDSGLTPFAPWRGKAHHGHDLRHARRNSSKGRLRRHVEREAAHARRGDEQQLGDLHRG